MAVALSLLEALTLTPMRTSQLLGSSERRNWVTRTGERHMQWLGRRYRGVLEPVLRWRWAVLLGAVVLFAGSLTLLRWVPKQFVPHQDQSIFLVRMQAPIGSSIEYTDAKFRKAEAWLQSRSDVVTRYFGSIGGFGGGEVDTGVLFVTMKPREERSITQLQFMDEARKALSEIGGIRPILMDLSQSGFTSGRGFPIEFSIRGPEWDRLGEYSKAIVAEMEKSGAFRDIDTDYRVGVPEVQVLPARAKAADRGVSMASIGRVIHATIGGVRVGKYTNAGRRYDVRVRLTPDGRAQSGDIRNLIVRNDRGEVIPLSDVVRVIEKPALQKVTRRNRERSIGVFANPAANVSQADSIRKAEEIASKILPAGYGVVFTGGSETFRESFRSLLVALVLGIVVAYMVLGSQFNSFLHPFTILLALPFSVTGGLLALLATGQSLNMFSMIGLLLLMGIVKKNSILLVDFTNEERAHGKPVREALLSACPTRLRPILMTSVSTVAAALPPALALGPGAETQIPMAIVVIGGVAVSTLLTLFVGPCAYEVLSPLERSKPHHLLDEPVS
jgi:HAE1 family hydrophobic/amphiphilic exporter-1